MRTVTPRDITKSISESSLESRLSDTQSVGINLIGQPPVTTLTLNNFFENVNKHKKQEELKENMLMYVFQKCSLYQHSNEATILRDMRYFLNASFPIQLQASRVHYMELINENPDSDKTMSLVAEEVLEKFEEKVQEGWIVLVGDGKTYQHLMNIKTTYGKALHKLLIFLVTGTY